MRRVLFRYLSPTISVRHRPFSSSSMAANRTYRSAIDKLNSLQSNAATLDAVRASGGRLSEFAIPEMLEYLEGIGHKPEDLNAMNVIHITGTKGKGSTSAFTSSILHEARPDWKIGLYTSPHLVAVRERIRINGNPLSEEEFAKFFFEVWDKLDALKAKVPTTPPKPGYFRFLTLLAFHVFLNLKVNATVLEVGVGGTYDSTNVVPSPIVTGVTALGIDHVAVLGKTLQEIAWQKGGIYKENVPAFSVEQPTEGMEVLRARASELKASQFTVTPTLPAVAETPLGLAGEHQKQNATLAVHLAGTFLQKQTGESYSVDTLSPTFKRGLELARWPGRCQIVQDPKEDARITWYLDGAHTLESLQYTADWFVRPGIGLPDSPSSSAVGRRVLLFNISGGRNGYPFLDGVLKKMSENLTKYGSSEKAEAFFDEVIFCTNVTYADGHFKGDLTSVSIRPEEITALTTQQQLAEAWSSLVPSFPAKKVHVVPSIEHAIRTVRSFEEGAQDPMKVLVSGSLLLVGGLIEVAGLSSVAL